MLANLKIGLNPPPWVLTPSGFDLSVPVLRTAFSEIATTPFGASLMGWAPQQRP
jgi:inosose dehydratase